jgi:tripartite ATP-independent transporter DctM subunit
MAIIALPEMQRYKYSPGFAGGTLAAGGTIGILIPPSVTLIIYGMMVEESIPKLFMAGFMPGLLVVMLYSAVAIVAVKKNPQLAPRTPSATWKERIFSLKGIWAVLIIFMLVMGGIYFGFFTATEAGAVGASGTLLVGLVRRKINMAKFLVALRATLKLSCMVLFLVIGAMYFSTFQGLSELPMYVGEYLISLPFSPTVILILMILCFFPLGCMMDALSMMLLMVPIFLPAIEHFGFSFIWFGILVTRAMEIGLITPPMGLNVFVIKGIMKESVSWHEIFKGVLIYFAMDIVSLILLILFPQIALFLPSRMGQ